MPYKVFKTGPPSKPFCVYKHDEQGEAVGTSLGCHPTREAANKQLAALYMNESIRHKAGKG